MYDKEELSFIVKKLKENGFNGNEKDVSAMFSALNKERRRQIPLIPILSKLETISDFVNINDNHKISIVKMIENIKIKSMNEQNKFNSELSGIRPLPLVEFNEDKGNFSIYGVRDNTGVIKTYQTGELSIFEVHGKKENGKIVHVEGSELVLIQKKRIDDYNLYVTEKKRRI